MKAAGGLPGATAAAAGKPAPAFNGTLLTGATLGETAAAAAAAMGAQAGGLITLYYGGSQKERDAQRLSDEVRAATAQADVEYYFGGQKNEEYVVSFDE